MDPGTLICNFFVVCTVIWKGFECQTVGIIIAALYHLLHGSWNYGQTGAPRTGPF